MAVDNLPPLHIGVAGLGEMGLLHAAIFNALPGSQVVAVAEPARQVREMFGTVNSSIRTYADSEAMLAAEALDGLVIAAPVAQRLSIALSCVDRRVPFFVEEPLAAGVEPAAPLVRALVRAPTPHMAAFVTRYVDAFEKGQAILASGCLGQLHRVTGSSYVSQRLKRGRGGRGGRDEPQNAGGGVLLSCGSHLLDLLTWYVGPVARLSADVLSAVSSDGEDFAHVMLEFRSGLRGWMDSAWSLRFHPTLETTIEVLGDNGSLSVSDDTLRLFLDEPAGDYPAGWTVLSAADLYRPVPVDVGGPHFTRADQAFLEVLRKGRAPEPDVIQALHVQRIVAAAYRSAGQGGAAERLLI